MTTRPLDVAYNWRTPAGLATAGLIVCIIVLARSKTVDWGTAVAAVVLLWAVFIAVLWTRSRALIEVDGDQLRVRRFVSTHVLDGSRVSSVREYLTGKGPSYKVRLVDDARTYYVPSAMVRQGQSTFLGWLLSHCPDADLDKGSRKTIDRLRTQGLIR